MTFTAAVFAFLFICAAVTFTLMAGHDFPDFAGGWWLHVFSLALMFTSGVIISRLTL